MQIRSFLFKNFNVSFFLLFVFSPTINAGSHFLFKDPAFLRRSLQSFQQVRNISLGTRFWGGVDDYTSKIPQRCPFDEFRMPRIDVSTIEAVCDFTRQSSTAHLLFLQINAFKGSDGATATDAVNQRLLRAAADEFAARKLKVLLVDEDCIKKAPPFYPYDVVIVNNLYFIRACGWDCGLPAGASSFLRDVLLSGKKTIVASYEPLSSFRDDVMVLDTMIQAQLLKNPIQKHYLIGPTADDS